jgi:hypothetical protein
MQLAATGKGHATVEAILMGAQNYDVETVDTSIVQPNFKSIIETKRCEQALDILIYWHIADGVSFVPQKYPSLERTRSTSIQRRIFDGGGTASSLNIPMECHSQSSTHLEIW